MCTRKINNIHFDIGHQTISKRASISSSLCLYGRFQHLTCHNCSLCRLGYTKQCSKVPWKSNKMHVHHWPVLFLQLRKILPDDEVILQTQKISSSLTGCTCRATLALPSEACLDLFTSILNKNKIIYLQEWEAQEILIDVSSHNCKAVGDGSPSLSLCRRVVCSGVVCRGLDD